MKPSITHSPVNIATKSEVLKGQLVYVEGTLIAVVSELSDTHNGDSGRWFIEASFGQLDAKQHRTFTTFEELSEYISSHYS